MIIQCKTYQSTGIYSASNAAVCRWLPDGPAMQDTMDSMVGKAYTYGRTFLTTKVSLHLRSYFPYRHGESTPTPTVIPSLPPR